MRCHWHEADNHHNRVPSLVLAVVAVTGTGEAAKPAPGTLTIAADHANVKFGGRRHPVRQAHRLERLAAAPCASRRTCIRSAPSANTGSATTNATGDWSLAVKPTANTRYRANVRQGRQPDRRRDGPPGDHAASCPTALRSAASASASRASCARSTTASRSSCSGKTSSGWKKVASPVLADIPGATCSKYSVTQACPPKRVLPGPLQRGRGPRGRQQPAPARDGSTSGVRCGEADPRAVRVGLRRRAAAAASSCRGGAASAGASARPRSRRRRPRAARRPPRRPTSGGGRACRSA